MRILFVTSETPFPPDNGVRIPTYHAMRLLSKAGHQLAWATMGSGTNACDSCVANIKDLCGSLPAVLAPLEPWPKLFLVVKSLLRWRPYAIVRYQSKRFRDQVRRQIAEFKPDVVHLDLMLMTQYSDIVPSGVGAVGSINDSDALAIENSLRNGQWSGMERLCRRVQLAQARTYERRVLPHLSLVHTMTEVDAAYLRRLNPNIRTVAIPNAVEDDVFDIVRADHVRRDICYTAHLVGANLLYLRRFLEEAWPLVRQQHPDVMFHVIGRLTPEVEPIICCANDLGGVIFEGYVKRLKDVYQHCGIAAVPINKNAGILNKAIEGMAAGLAVVGLPLTFSGIPEVQPSVHCLVGQDCADMARCINRLLNNPGELLRIRSAGHELAALHYRWSSRLPRLEKMYETAVKIAQEVVS